MSDEMPPYALWLFGLAACGWIVGPVIGYFLGLRSKSESAKREARIAVLAVIDQARMDVLACRYLPQIVVPMQMRLKDPIFNFSARFAAKRRGRIETAWRAYQSVGEDDVHPDNRAFRDGQPSAEKARLLLLEPLEKLRAEIDSGVFVRFGIYTIRLIFQPKFP